MNNKQHISTLIVKSKPLSVKKIQRLNDLAQKLGKVRDDVWQEFGSMKGATTNFRKMRNEWVAQKKVFGVPAEYWKQTAQDAFHNIELNRAAIMVNVKRDINNKYPNNKLNKDIRKNLYTSLKTGDWVNDKYLCRLFRKYFHRGHNHTDNQLVLGHNRQFRWFENNGTGYIQLIGLGRKEKISVPLHSNYPIDGTIRVILKDDYVAVHYNVKHEYVKPCGTKEIGLDKGYTEAFMGSDGKTYGEGLGKKLSAFSDKKKEINKNRNKLRAIAKNHKDTKKAEKIFNNNLGTKKRSQQQERHRANVKRVVDIAVNQIVDNHGHIVVEDLTKNFKSKKRIDKNQTRRLNSWIKGVLAESLNIISDRRGASLTLINPAYTSQICCLCGAFGKRKGDIFYCASHGELDADINAACNILGRASESQISRFTPYKEVREILQKCCSRSVETIPPGLELHKIKFVSTKSELSN